MATQSLKCDGRRKMEQSIPSVALTNCVAIATRSTVTIPFLPVMKAHKPFILKTHSWCSVQPNNRKFRTTENVSQIPSVAKTEVLDLAL